MFKIGMGCLRKVCTSVLPVLLLGHTFNDHNSLSGSICSATAMFSFHTFSVVFHYILPSGLFLLSLSDPSNCSHVRTSDISSFKERTFL